MSQQLLCGVRGGVSVLCRPPPRARWGQIREAMTFSAGITGICFRRQRLGWAGGALPNASRAALGALCLRPAAPRATLPRPRPPCPLESRAGMGRRCGPRIRGGGELEGTVTEEGGTARDARRRWYGERRRAGGGALIPSSFAACFLSSYSLCRVTAIIAKSIHVSRLSVQRK